MKDKYNHLKFFIETTEDLFVEVKQTKRCPLEVFLGYYPERIDQNDLEWLLDWACADLHFMRGEINKHLARYRRPPMSNMYMIRNYVWQRWQIYSDIAAQITPMLHFCRNYNERKFPAELCDKAWNDLGIREQILKNETIKSADDLRKFFHTRKASSRF